VPHPSSEPTVIEHAAHIVERAEVQMFDRMGFLDQDLQARRFRERWRLVGLGWAAMVLVIGLATTGDKSFLNAGWIIGALLIALLGVMIGSYVYRKRAPW